VLIEERKYRTAPRSKTRFGVVGPERATNISLHALVDATGAGNAKSQIAFGVSDRCVLRILIWPLRAM
jgi:hypothetical protein